MLYHLRLYDAPGFNQTINISKKTKTQKFSTAALEMVKQELSKVKNKEDYFRKLSKEFQSKEKDKKVWYNYI